MNPQGDSEPLKTRAAENQKMSVGNFLFNPLAPVIIVFGCLKCFQTNELECWKTVHDSFQLNTDTWVAFDWIHCGIRINGIKSLQISRFLRKSCELCWYAILKSLSVFRFLCKFFNNYCKYSYFRIRRPIERTLWINSTVSKVRTTLYRIINSSTGKYCSVIQ